MADLMSKEESFSQLSAVTRPLNTVNGVLVPYMIKQHDMDKYAASISLEPSDVWIVTYPKAGTTWSQQIVKLIRNGGESDDKTIDVSVPWLEANALFKLDLASLPKPRAFKSHFPYELLPCGKPNTTPCKYVYVARNPKDVAVSFYFHYCRGHLIPDANLEWNLFFRNFVYGSLDFGDYFDHVLSWWAHKDDENVLFLTYEEMKKDLPTAVARIANFIQCDVTDDVITKVTEKTSFDVMKNDDTTNYSWAPPEFFKPGTTFMRKGEVGDWKNYFTPEQSAEMDKICCERLNGSGLEFDFEDTC